MKKNILLFIGALALSAALISCEEGEGDHSNATTGPYIIAANSSSATYMVQSEDLSEGTYTIVGNGKEVVTPTAWVFYKNKYAYRLVYNQGSAGTGSSYMRNSAGKVVERSEKFEISNRFTTYGPYGNYIITAASGATAEKDEATGLSKYGVTFTYLDVEAQTLKTRTIVTEDMVGNGEYFTVSGIVESAGKLYTALCPQGLSAYGAARNNGEFVVEGATVDAESGTVSPTQHPDNVWVAIYDNVDFENPTILHDSRLSYASSRYRSQFYSNIVPDDDGNVYVFSSAYASVAEGIHKTTKPCGVIRINAGHSEFDQSYFFNIEEAADGLHLFKVWHITGDYFLLQMYSTTDMSTNGQSKKLAVFKGVGTSFRWVEDGLPAHDDIAGFGSTPFFENGLAYMPVSTNDGNPAVYIIDPLTATATKGAQIKANSIGAVGKLEN